jgi:hypothetical protein
MRRFTRNVFIVMVLVCAMAYIATAATVTQSINYQGKITDSSGNPLEGTYTVVFTIYDVPTGGTGLTGSIQSVRFTDGYFNTTLGLTNYYDGRALWLGIRVGSDTEMTPRQEIRPVPYALSLRPGAGIISTEWYPALDLRNSGGGMALNVSTSGSNSKGTVIKTTGTGGYGVDVNTTSSGSPGFYADTWGSGSQGFAANTHGADSPGVDVAAWGTGNSYGVMAYSDQSSAIYADTGRADQMYGLYCNDILFSRGIHLETATTGHEGARITTTGANSYGVNINTGNTNSPYMHSLMVAIARGSPQIPMAREVTGWMSQQPVQIVME